MYTRNGVVVVLPLVQAGNVVGVDFGNLQQVDVLLHTSAATALIGIVAAHVKDPVGGRTGKCLIVAIEVCLQTSIGRSHKAFYRRVVNLLAGELSLRNGVEHIITRGENTQDADYKNQLIYCRFHCL